MQFAVVCCMQNTILLYRMFTHLPVNLYFIPLLALYHCTEICQRMRFYINMKQQHIGTCIILTVIHWATEHLQNPAATDWLAHCATAHLAVQQLVFVWWDQFDCDQGWQWHNKCSSVNASVLNASKMKWLATSRDFFFPLWSIWASNLNVVVSDAVVSIWGDNLPLQLNRWKWVRNCCEVF